jgi:hypothetical protein
VLRTLDSSGLIRVGHAGRAARITVPNPRALLTAWTDRYDWTRNEALAIAAPIGDVSAFLPIVGAAIHRAAPSLRRALTLQAGAALIAPHAAWDRIHVYVGVSRHAELRYLATGLGWSPSEEGRLVLLRPYYRHSIWEGLLSANGIPLVSKLQLVLDLWHYPVRGRAEAEVLLAHAYPWLATP